MDKKHKKEEQQNEKPASDEAQKENEIKKIVELEKEINELEGKWKRALADYQNQEKWMREQRIDWIKTANRDLLLRILPVLDTLILAQQHGEDKTIGVSIDQFLVVLKGEGVTRIETVGKEFDPNIMEVITTENGEENKVVSEIRAGFLLHDKVLRPAQVTVGNGEIKN